MTIIAFISFIYEFGNEYPVLHNNKNRNQFYVVFYSRWRRNFLD